MTRRYANVSTAIWRKEDDFTDLTGSAQRTYFLLLTQQDISAAGVLPLTVGRWASKARDTTPESIRADIADLVAARYVAVDEVTEELLVRTFVKWDEGYANPKRRPVIKRAAEAIESQALRLVLAVELDRVGLPLGWAGIERSDLPYAQVDSLSGGLRDAVPDTDPASDGVVVTQGPYIDTSTLDPHPPTPDAPTVADRVEPREGEGDPEPRRALIAEIREKRPEWSTKSIGRALDHPDVAERPWPVIVAAFRAVAGDPLTHAPGRLAGDGPWWTGAPRARDPTPLEPPCGECDPNRQITTEDGRVARCPNCHPLRRPA